MLSFVSVYYVSVKQFTAVEPGVAFHLSEVMDKPGVMDISDLVSYQYFLITTYSFFLKP